MLLSPPVTMTTSLPASSTMATALSTAAWAIWNSPAARPSRCSCEFEVNSTSTFTPWRSKMPCDAAAIAGSACAPGNILTLRDVCANATPQTLINIEQASFRNIEASSSGQLDYHFDLGGSHASGTHFRPDPQFIQPRRARPGAARGVHRPADLRARDAAHPRARLDLLRPRFADPQGGRLLHGADRPPADADGARLGRRHLGALQPLPAPGEPDVRRPP